MILGPLLGAGAGLAGAFLNRDAQQDANNINWLNLFETKRRNRETERLAKASRRDAYGNLLEYIPGVGWVIDTTPMTEAILGASQKEELASLREDAPRNRAAAERMDARSQMADDEFERKFNEFRFRPRTTEAVEEFDATQTLLNARRKGLDESSAILGRQLLRTGGSSDLERVYKTANDQYAQSLVDAMLEGKRLGRQAFAEKEGADLQRLTGELGFLKNVADTTTTSPVARPTIGDQLTGRGDDAARQLIAAIQSGHSPLQQAYGTLSQGIRNSALDLSGVASLLSRLDFGSSQPEEEELASAYDPWAGLRSVTI